MSTLVFCVEHHVSICCLLQYLFSVITLTGKAEPAIAVIGEEECEIQGWRSGCWGECGVCHGGQCVQTIHQMVVTSHSDSMGRYSPISRVMHYLYNGKGGLRYHPWHLLLPWFMADMSHNTDYTRRLCCCGVYSQRLRVTSVEVLDRTDGVWWTHHLPAHEFWQNVGMNHFNATPQTNFTVVHDFCTCWECAEAFRKRSRVSKEVQMCGFVHCKRAEALVE